MLGLNEGIIIYSHWHLERIKKPEKKTIKISSNLMKRTKTIKHI